MSGVKEWQNEVLDDVHKAVKRLRKKRKKTKNMILTSPTMIKHLKELQKEFVFVPTDKAGNNICCL